MSNECCSYAPVVEMETLRLEDGRTLEFCRSAPEDPSDLLVFHVGTPSAAAVFPNIASAAAARGLCTVSYSRAGYGGSTRNPGRTVAEEAANTAALVDNIGAGSFVVAGWSGGGSAALACAALLPDRVRSCAVLAGASPPEEVGEVWYEWCSQEDRDEFRTFATSSPDAFVSTYEEAAVEIAALTPRELTEWPGGPDADREAFTRDPELAEALADSMHRSVARGVGGWLDDGVALARPWGFHVEDIDVPVTVRHGELDSFVQVEHGRWLAEHIPNARAQILSGHGHASIADPFDDVIDALLETRG
jgi:pimeloyl-ACP methyl ester carboxylesterase